MASKKSEAQVPATRDIFEDFPADKFNLLIPSRTFFENVGPMHAVSVEAIQLDLKKHTYEPDDAEGKRAINAIGLSLTASLAAISFGKPEIEHQGRRCTVSIPAFMQKPDGTPRMEWGSYSIDLDADKRNGMSAKRLRKREQYIVPLCETGAMNRAIRKFLAIGTFSPAELQKPFAIPRVDFRPDYNDPQVKRFLLEQATGAKASLYPPQGQAVEAEHKLIENGGQPEPETDELDQALDASPEIDHEIEQKIAAFKAMDKEEQLKTFAETVKSKEYPIGPPAKPSEIRMLWREDRVAAYRRLLEWEGGEEDV